MAEKKKSEGKKAKSIAELIVEGRQIERAMARAVREAGVASQGRGRRTAAKKSK